MSNMSRKSGGIIARSNWCANLEFGLNLVDLGRMVVLLVALNFEVVPESVPFLVESDILIFTGVDRAVS